MRNIVLAVVLVFISVLRMFGQTGQAGMTPTTVVAGKNIVITVTLDKAPSVERTTLTVLLVPHDRKGNPQPFNISLTPKDTDPKVYTTTYMVPQTAKGKWSIQVVRLEIPDSGVVFMETNHPEIEIKPIDVSLPTKGKVEVTAQ